MNSEFSKDTPVTALVAHKPKIAHDGKKTLNFYPDYKEKPEISPYEIKIKFWCDTV